MESSTQPCTELPPTPTGDQSQQSSGVWGFFFPPFTSRKETWNTFLHYIFHWRQGKPHDAGDIYKSKTLLFPQLLYLRGRKRQIFAFQLLISSLSSAAATDTLQGFTFIIWKAAREVKNMQMWPIKKRQEVLLQHSWWHSSTAEPHHHGNKQISSWSLSLKPDFLIYPCATQAITANNSALHLIWWINPTFSLSPRILQVSSSQWCTQRIFREMETARKGNTLPQYHCARLT